LILLGMTLLLSAGLFSLSLGAQNPPPKPPVEEEDPKQKPPRKPIPVEEDDRANNPKKPSSSAATPTELAREAERPNLDPATRDLFRRLAYPHDLVTTREGVSKVSKVVPIPYYLGRGSTYQGKIQLQHYNDKWNLGVSYPVSWREIEKIQYYEEQALFQVEEYLKNISRTGEPGANLGLARLEKVQAADKVLAAVLRFHKPAPNKLAREGSGWKDLTKRLEDKLLEIRLEQLRILTNLNNWEDSFALADSISKLYADPKVQDEVSRRLVPLVETPLNNRQYEEGLRRLLLLENFPNGSAAAPIREKLRNQAAALFNEARTLEAKGDRTKAKELADRADKLWPRLQGLREFHSRLSDQNPTLGVGVHDLPELMSPATAVTDSERHAVEFLFESLVKPRMEPDGTWTYEPALALNRPRMTIGGRQFQLDPETYWSSGEKVSETDIRLTVQLLRKPGWAGFAPEWADLMEQPVPEKDLSRVTLAIHQGFLNPLSLMTFKILPAASHALTKPDDKEFGRHPIGSGPFQLPDQAARQRERSDGTVVFVANSAYRRASKSGLPQIQEIRFFQSRDPLDDFEKGKLHLLLDLPTTQIQKIRSLDSIAIHTLRNRRIYFLAVNHRNSKLQNPALRKAIAHSINRNQILDDVFRGDLKDAKEPPHRPLNGPFPPDSWACKKNLPADPFQPNLARQEANAAKSALVNLKFTLKYPFPVSPSEIQPGDIQVKEACEKIQEQLKTYADIELDLQPRSPRELHDDVEVNHDYELAYYSYDYPNEQYWLWPLFNPHKQALERGGRNYLGYQNDGELARDFQLAMIHRNFTDVQTLTQKIHVQLHDKMPFIPLWQLDTHIAVHKDLVPAYLDPLLIFTHVEKWKLNKK
ncbi:MAG TPA: ABC transporter substrate-binding protein, partial [Gemmataceae bacterium]|nr:ABC transporter substrate-binding protein [Gemmataceae bacterium]